SSDSNVAASSFSIANVYGCEPAHVPALRGARWNFVLSAVELNSGSALLCHRSRRRAVALHLNHFFPFTLVGRADCYVRTKASAYYWSGNRRVWVCAFHATGRGWQLVDKFFPGHCCSLTRVAVMRVS